MPFGLDRLAVRRQFDRRLADPGPGDFLLHEVARRMMDRLALVKIAPARILDVGCGLGVAGAPLRARWPLADGVGVDLAPRRAALAASRDRLKGWAALRARAPRLWRGAAEPWRAYVAADTHALPLASNSFDLIWSNLAAHWFDEPARAFAEWSRVLRPGGVLMFSAWGVDTVAELRAAGASLPSWPDMHDLGDALVHAGFAEPVMDTERLTVTWPNATQLLNELRALGGNPLRGRAPGCRTPRQRAAALAALEGHVRSHSATAELGLTFEVIFGHAWCNPRKDLPKGVAPLVFRPRVAQ